MVINMVKDHLGNKFDSIIAMCSYWKITPAQYYSRLKSGYDLEYILTTKRKHKRFKKTIRFVNGECRDHLGNTFGSIASMCSYWGISYATFYKRIRTGCNLKQALTFTKYYNPSNATPITDHLGNRFKCIKDLCNYHNASYSCVLNSLRSGVDIKTVLESSPKVKVVIDHIGNKFSSERAMCREHNISFNTYRARKYKGYTIQECLYPGRLPIKSNIA